MMRIMYAVAVMLAWAGPAGAQPCPADEDVAPWTSVDAGAFGPASTTLPAPTAVAFCSTTAGFGPTSDAYRYAFQMRENDFVLEALVDVVEPGGSAGLVAVVPSVQSAEAARVVVVVEVAEDGSAVLRSSIRQASGGATDPDLAELTVVLPVSIRLVREGTEVRTEIVGGETHLTAELEPDGELMGPVRVGVAHASNDPLVARSASVSRISLSAPAPGPDLDCIDAQPAMGGAPFEMHGRHLDLVEGVDIGGMPATITEASASRLVVEAPRGAGGGTSGPVEVHYNGRSARVGTASFTGGTIRRGDLDEDGAVDAEDVRLLCHHVYRSAPLECSAAGDVDADGDLDADDFDRLRRFVDDGGDPPAEPFADPGWIAGTLACGMPNRPSLHALSFADGSAIDRPVREGDELALTGASLPPPERAVIRFGNTPGTPSPDSTPERLVFRIGKVLRGGAQCPRIFDAEPAVAGETRFGPAYGLPDGAELCIELEASALEGHLQSEIVDGQLEIDVPPTSLRPGTVLRVELSLHLPFVVGTSRGPRDASFGFRVPNVDYPTALAQLARRVREAIHGQSSDDCDCEVAATDVWTEEKLILPPCALLPDLPPEPPMPGLPTQIQPTKLIWSVMDIYNDLPGPGCAGEIDLQTEPRRFFWCELEAVSEIQGGDAPALLQGLPLWETYRPAGGIVEPDPRLRPMDQKKILFSEWAHWFLEVPYRNGCEMAYRATLCTDDFWRTWMPAFFEDERVIKTFWKPLDDLPASVDESSLYSWDPPDMERQYLVGMHIGHSIGEAHTDPPSYFLWSTFWLPAGDDETTKDGSPIESVMSPHCSAGSGADRPASLEGTPFAQFSMCTDSREGEEGCGNPWEPGECPPGGPTSCTGCHTSMGTLHLFNEETPYDLDPLRVGWLPSIVGRHGSAANACLLDVYEHPEDVPEHWVPIAEGFEPDICHTGGF